MIKAVLFDFDGVMSDTFPYHFQAWQKTFNKQGIEPIAEIIRKNEGSPAFKIAQAVAREKGVVLDDEQARTIADEKNALFRKISKAQPYPQIKSILELIDKMGGKSALVTGTALQNVHKVLPPLIIDHLSTIVTDKDTRRGKPFPDPYLKAIEQLDLSPRECLVVENAPLGITAALQSKAHCVALKTTLPKEDLLDADWIFDNHTELLEFIRFLDVSMR